MKFLQVTAVALLLAASALAGDVTGKWKGTVETPQGSRETTLTLKAEGANLTGSISGRQGETPIQEGKVDGDNVSFAVVRNFQGNEVKMQYKGKLEGTELKLTYSMGERSMQLNLKRAE
ncbi:MAG: hypothetical protein FJW20_06060 [Acidimicrobiia bacterium]|nr:hypothetical protein [Acidimicrobiia bacterium]